MVIASKPSLFQGPQGPYGPYECEILKKVPEDQGPPYWIHALDDDIPSYFYSRGDAERCLSEFRERYPDQEFRVGEFMRMRRVA